MRNPKLAILGLSGLLAVVIAAPAQEKKAQEKKMEAPKPGPEVKKLGYFAGTWKSEGEIKQNPFMPAGKFSGADKCEWFQGGYHVVCHSTGKGPMGDMHGLGIISYNQEEKVYTYYGVDNMGFAELSKGTVQGSNWVFTSESKMGGKTFHGRYSMTDTSPNSYNFKWETSEDGKSWTLVMEGKSTKT